MNKKEPVGLKKLSSQPLALALTVLAFLLLAQTTPLAAQVADQLDLALTPEVALDTAATDDHTVIYYFGHDQLDANNNKIELANIMMPKQLEREIIGNDGAPMVLVPEGDFFYGSDNRRLSLLNFYMDKFEVTTAQYAKFLGSMEKWENCLIPRLLRKSSSRRTDPVNCPRGVDRMW